MLLIAMASCYAIGVVVPPCFAGRPRVQNVIAHGAAGLASALGVMARCSLPMLRWNSNGMGGFQTRSRTS